MDNKKLKSSAFLFTRLNKNMEIKTAPSGTNKNLGGLADVFVKKPEYEITPRPIVHKIIKRKTLLSCLIA